MFELIRRCRFAVLGIFTVSLLATVGADGLLGPAASAAPGVCTIVLDPTPEHHTSCPGGRFVGANLRNRDFSYADLSGADLARANLDGADLSHAKLSEAKLLAAE